MDENEDAFENKPSLSCTHQIILNFLGLGSKNSYLPIGDIFDLKEFNAEHVHGADLSFIYGSCIMIAYYFHEFDAARDLIEKCRKYIQYGKIYLHSVEINGNRARSDFLILFS